MKPIKLIVDVPVDPDALLALQRLGSFDIDCLMPPAEVARPVETDRIRAAELLFCTIPPTNVSEMEALKWMQIASTGYSQLFGLGLPERGIRVTNSRGCFDVPIAEWNLAMMINLARDTRQMIRNQDQGVWDRSAQFQREIRGLTVGFWGYGGIGRESARLCRQLGLEVHVLTRSGVAPRAGVFCVPGTGDSEGVLPQRVFRSGQEIEFLSNLDFLVVALPLTKATEGLIGERELRALPPRAFVLNPARGPIIQQPALLRALREHWISGAALDTHYQYPLPPEHPLWAFSNVIMTPHISGSNLSSNFRKRLWQIFLLNAERYIKSEALLNELTPAQLAGA